MKKILLSAPLLAVFFAIPAYAVERVNSDFTNSKGEKIGTATLKEMENGALISIDVQLPEGAHAIHIHENGKCDMPDFKTAGGHYNPEGHTHGMNSKDGFHAGDLPNLYVESTGHIKTEIFSTRLHLSGQNGINHGTIIIHEKADDYTTDPTGNAGSRIACAVIKS